MPITANQRGYGVGSYGIEVEGKSAGWLKSADGGHATAEVITDKIGSDHLGKKHLGPLKYEDISIVAGAGMSADIYRWIQTGFNQTSNDLGRRGGALVFGDKDYNEVSRLTWKFGLMTEFAMPALDAASKDSCYMTIKFAPEVTEKTWGKGGKLKFPTQAAVGKQWTPSNFKLELDGCPQGCKWVNKIEALTIKQKVTENAVGELRNYEKLPTSVEIPNLVITLSESHADEFYQWHEDFVIKGNNNQEKERGATLYYLTSNLQKTLFTLKFLQLGIFKISPDKMEAGSEPVRRIKVEMYCEDIQFDYSADAQMTA